VRALLAALAALWLLPATAQSMYKWVDENGMTHFTETPPPPGAKGGKIDVKPTPPSSNHASDDPATWKERARTLEQQRHERENAEENARKTAQRDRTERQQRCRKAHIALDQLNSAGPLYNYDDKGERHYLSDEERPAQIARAKKVIAETCD
jgi:hypothetical protein